MAQSYFSNDDASHGAAEEEGGRHSTAWVLTFCAAAVIAFAGGSIPRGPSRDSGTEESAVGHALPDLRLEPLTGGGQPVRPANLAGKVVLLDFWGTWCPPCRAELPHLAALADNYRDRADFQLLAVSCGQGDDDPQSLAADTQEFLKDQKLDIATYFDPNSYTRREATKIGAFEGAFPNTLVLDRQGVIRGMWVGVGPETERQIGQLIAKLLAEPTSK